MCPTIVVFPTWFNPVPYSSTTDFSNADFEYSDFAIIGTFRFVAGISIVPAIVNPSYFCTFPAVDDVVLSPSSTPENISSSVFVLLSLFVLVF